MSQFIPVVARPALPLEPVRRHTRRAWRSTVEFRADQPPTPRPSVPRLPVAAVLADILVDHDVEAVFGIPGGSISPLLDALLDRPQIRHVLTRQENGAVFAAAGYAMTTGKVGVVAVTSGPGVLNAVTGIASAHCDGIPIVVLVGEVPRARQGRAALQDGSAHGLDIRHVLSSLTKRIVEITDPGMAATVMHDAMRLAAEGRPGPVVVTLPTDIFAHEVIAPHIYFGDTRGPSLSEHTLDIVEQALRNTRPGRGLILAGSGLRRDRASTDLIELAERLDWPVVTTSKAKGVFPADHPLSLGVYGMAGHASAHHYVQAGVDTLLAIATGFGDLVTNGGRDDLRPRDTLIHVDIDPRQFGRTYAPQIAVHAMAREFCRELVARLPAAPRRRAPRRRQPVIEYAIDPTVTRTTATKLGPHHALCELQAQLPVDTIFTVDAGDHHLFAAHYLRINRPDSYVAMSGLGSMGCSLGAAIGAKLAAPHRTVVAIIGDGCLAMSAGELATATATGLGIIVVVLNNRTLGMIEGGARSHFGRAPDYTTDPLRVAPLARSFGADAETIANVGQIEALGSRLRQPSSRPLVLDVHIDGDVRLPANACFGGSPSTAPASE